MPAFRQDPRGTCTSSPTEPRRDAESRDITEPTPDGAAPPPSHREATGHGRQPRAATTMPRAITRGRSLSLPGRLAPSSSSLALVLLGALWPVDRFAPCGASPSWCSVRSRLVLVAQPLRCSAVLGTQPLCWLNGARRDATRMPTRRFALRCARRGVVLVMGSRFVLDDQGDVWRCAPARTDRRGGMRGRCAMRARRGASALRDAWAHR